MLNCGSDALPYPEGQRGAYAQIRAAGHDAIATHDIVMELVHLDRAAAQTYLAAKGFTSLQQEQILHATHCTPPESYLVVASEQLLKPGSWMHLGLWDFRRAYIAQRARFMPQARSDCRSHNSFGLYRRPGHPPVRSGASVADRRANDKISLHHYKDLSL